LQSCGADVSLPPREPTRGLLGPGKVNGSRLHDADELILLERQPRSARITTPPVQSAMDTLSETARQPRAGVVAASSLTRVRR
jgi:hypothetical protein